MSDHYHLADPSQGDGYPTSFNVQRLTAIGQTTSLILQCIGCGQQRLALTQLELVSIYVGTGWWHKPLEPVVYFRGTSTDNERQNVRTRHSNGKPDISPLSRASQRTHLNMPETLATMGVAVPSSNGSLASLSPFHHCGNHTHSL